MRISSDKINAKIEIVLNLYNSTEGNCEIHIISDKSEVSLLA